MKEVSPFFLSNSRGGEYVENPICSMELEIRKSVGWHPAKCDLPK